jgi:hypothetical protein
MAREKAEELKTIKIAASTYTRLTMMATIFNKTISEMIADLMIAAYPDVAEEADRILERMAEIRETTQAKKGGTQPSKNEDANATEDE